jgi:hypothetical protein
MKNEINILHFSNGTAKITYFIANIQIGFKKNYSFLTHEG